MAAILGFDPLQPFWRSWATLMGGGDPSPVAARDPLAPDPRPFVEAMHRFLAAASTSSAATATRAFTEFLRDHYAACGSSWLAGVPPMGVAAVGSGLAEGFPAMGPTREYQERARRMIAAASRYDEAQRRLQRLWSDLLGEAATAFAARALTSAPAQPTPAALHELFDLWIDSAEEAYSRAAHGESFCKALADSVNAMSEWRRDMQSTIEDSAKLFDQPTRGELDSLARRVNVLEGELRALQGARKSPRAAARRTAGSTSKP